MTTTNYTGPIDCILCGQEFITTNRTENDDAPICSTCDALPESPAHLTD